MKAAAKAALFRRLPAVDELLRSPAVAALSATDGAVPVTDAARAVLGNLRQEINSGLLNEEGLDLALAEIPGAIERELRRALTYSLRAVVNATGVILHTNLGRAPLGVAALEHALETAAVYSNLEFDVERGERGRRDVHLDRLFRRLLSRGWSREGSAGGGPGGKAEAAVACSATAPGSEVAVPDVSSVVVNNNAAAVLLALNTLAEGGEAIVSRGELVEIGGSFRIPDVMAKSGAVLREVGTTNRTRIGDYENAITGRTRLLLRVHRSNFAISGFTEQASIAELVTLARKHQLPLMEDLGSGALLDLRLFGIAGEPGILDSLGAGVDVVTYSGDKLLGGPQSGLISGRDDLVARMRANCLFRALRVDKLTYAALEATLMAYVKRDHDAVPALRMMRLNPDEIGQRAEALLAGIAFPRWKAEVLDGESVIGGGAAPSSVLPTRLLALSRDGMAADELLARLRASEPPIIARVEEGRVIFDLRTVFPDQDETVRAAIAIIG